MRKQTGGRGSFWCFGDILDHSASNQSYPQSSISRKEASQAFTNHQLDTDLDTHMVKQGTPSLSALLMLSEKLGTQHPKSQLHIELIP